MAVDIVKVVSFQSPSQSHDREKITQADDATKFDATNLNPWIEHERRFRGNDHTDLSSTFSAEISVKPDARAQMEVEDIHVHRSDSFWLGFRVFFRFVRCTHARTHIDLEIILLCCMRDAADQSKTAESAF